jgi:hypothetical protein
LSLSLLFIERLDLLDLGGHWLLEVALLTLLVRPLLFLLLPSIVVFVVILLLFLLVAYDGRWEILA